MRHSASGIFPLIHLCDKLDTLHGQAVNLHISRHFSPCRINLDPTPNFHFSRAQSKPPDVKSWTTFFTIFYFRSASTSRRKSLIFLDIPPFFSLAVYFFALIFIFIAEDARKIKRTVFASSGSITNCPYTIPAVLFLKLSCSSFTIHLSYFIAQQQACIQIAATIYTQACPRTSLFCFLLYQLSLWWVKYRAQPEAIST